MKLLNTIKTIFNEYPRQFWLMITGIVIATAGGSMIWPFMLIYASGKLNLPLSTVAALISINAGTGLVSSLVAGTLADQIGRKGVMVFSLAVTGIAYFLMMHAETYPHFAGLMVMIGLSNPTVPGRGGRHARRYDPLRKTDRRVRHQPHRQQRRLCARSRRGRLSRRHFLQPRLLRRVPRLHHI